MKTRDTTGFESVLRGLRQAKEHQEGTKKSPVHKVDPDGISTDPNYKTSVIPEQHITHYAKKERKET